MKKIGRTIVESLSHDCRGIAKIDGKITFIEYALPNEDVEFIYTKNKKEFDEASVTRVIQKNPERVEPKCKHFTVCGGCDLQHMTRKSQLVAKENILLDLFIRFAHIKPKKLLEPLYSEEWHYRHKARLSVRYVQKKSTTLVGFREKHSPRYIAQIQSCEILHPKVAGILLQLQVLCNNWSSKDSIAQIEVAAGDKELALIFRHLKDLEQQDYDNLQNFALEHGVLIYLQSGGLDTVKLLYPEKLYPEKTDEFLQYTLPEYAITFNFFPTDFTQVNLPLNRKMVFKALELLELKADDIVLDMFCGIGNFTLPIAKFVSKVIGVELSQDMVLRAQYNAQYNQIENAIFKVANLDLVWPNIENYKVNKLLIDPPRAGALEVVKQIDKISPSRIVYISCNPATLARDAALLVEKGYILTKTFIIDMFAQTLHIESMSLFEKSSGE